MNVAGRLIEINILQKLLRAESSDFVAMYGRRRIGKTYLIREVYQKNIIFDCSGLHEKQMSQQLENFWHSMTEANIKQYTPPKTWLTAFAILKEHIKNLKGDKKKVIFLDEISWFDTPRSGFLAALDNFWNQFCTKRNDIILIICGSAASWIIDKVINNRGGLHNRITRQIQLMPFTLQETKAFLDMKRVNLSLKDITSLQMCLGGVPFYMKDIEPGESVQQILDDLFFKPHAKLKNEFGNLYQALFKNSNLHEEVVKALATKNKGLTRDEIITQTGLNSGGAITTVLEELIACGFIIKIYPLNKIKTESLYRLIDEFTLFYYKYMLNQKPNTSWVKLLEKQSFVIWSGYAFENLCFKHISQIKKSLGIQGIITNEYSWLQKGNEKQEGAQIDMIIDRDDNCMNMLEMKYYSNEFEVSRDYAEQLRKKTILLKAKTKNRKNVFITFLSVFGVKKNEHYLSVATNQLLIDDLFV